MTIGVAVDSATNHVRETATVRLADCGRPELHLHRVVIDDMDVAALHATTRAVGGCVRAGEWGAAGKSWS